MARRKKRILGRYERDVKGRVVIEVAAKRVEELYERFDMTAPYQKKDFDDDLVAYLSGCVREIGKAEFVIRFSFDQPPSTELMQLVRSSLHTFFMYRAETEFVALRKQGLSSLLLLVSGMVILALTLRWEHLPVVMPGSFGSQFFYEGLTIAAWVALWEGLVQFLFSGPAGIHRFRLWRRIARAPVFFEQR